MTVKKVRSAGPPQASTTPSGGSEAHEVASVGANKLAGDADCWCVQLPRIMRVPPAPANPGQADISAASCYCPACLQQITNERQAKLLSPAPD